MPPRPWRHRHPLVRHPGGSGPGQQTASMTSAPWPTASRRRWLAMAACCRRWPGRPHPDG